MVRKMAITLCLLASCFWCLTLVARVDSAPPARTQEGCNPVASINALMQGQGRFFDGITWLLEDPSARDRASRLHVEAQVLAELANVNTRHRSERDYVGWAAKVRDTALELSGEAEKGKKADEGRMKSLYTKLKKTCIACHDRYQ